MLQHHVPNLNIEQASLRVLLDVHVDRKVCVDISHFVFEASHDTNNQVVDDRLDCAEGCNVLASAVVQFDIDDIIVGAGEADGKV